MTASHLPWRRSRTPSALDEPLPVASILAGQWKARRKINRTPRRLATLLTNPGPISDTSLQEDSSGTLLCIAGEEYIVVANTVSNIYIYRLTEECLGHPADDSGVSPWATVCLREQDTSAAIVSLVALPFGKSLIYGETCRKDEGHVVAFSDDGQGFIVRIRKDGGACKVYEFSTQNFGVTCCSVVSTSPGSEDCQLLVGYQTGYLENWKIFRFSTEKIMAKLLWRGVYPNSYWIQHIAPLNIDSTASHDNTNGDPDNETSDDTNNKKTAPIADPSRYLLVTLLSPKQPLKTSALVEVIDIGALANDWKHKKEVENEHGHGHLRAMDLGTRWIMPQAGMEILNSSTISNSADDPSGAMPRRAHFIPSTATGSICTLAQGNCAALADGTIAMISSREKQAELQWGIANDYNQLLLPYPAIGCAALNWGSTTSAENQDGIPHVACCLRGGSTYLIHFVPPESGDGSDSAETGPITVFTPDAETHSRYIHGFTAGNLVLSGSDSSTTTPVLLYGWPGGIINVFSCELRGTTRCRPMLGPREIAALGELVSNESTSMLTSLLSSMDDTDPLLLQPVWKKAWEESKRESLEETTVKDLLLPKFSGMQALLLLLSTDSLEGV